MKDAHGHGSESRGSFGLRNTSNAQVVRGVGTLTPQFQVQPTKMRGDDETGSTTARRWRAYNAPAAAHQSMVNRIARWFH